MKIPFKRAILSVYYKDGIIDLAKALVESGCEIISTGSTAATIRAAGLPVTSVSDITKFPECFDGRVKTLHPLIHGGILANRELKTHQDQLVELGIQPIDLVVVNLYPFQETVASGAAIPECVEQIDIGGPTMIRAAAKNHASVAVIVDPSRYQDAIDAAHDGGFDAAARRCLAAEAFAHTAQYDAAVAQWTSQTLIGAHVPEYRGGAWLKQADLRYGENPHQQAALYVRAGSATGLAHATQLGGKEMSYNNYQDVDAAIRAAYDHSEPAVAVVKHANPCGVAIADRIELAYERAHACDPQSAYGGVIAANREVNLAMAQQVKPIFTEVIAAPSYEPAALELLQTKKNLRILVVEPEQATTETKEISGGLLVQERDTLNAAGDDPQNWTLVAGEPADSATMRDLEFAWRAIRSVRSNAILLANDGATVGIGMGQVNRVDSCRLSVERANTLGISVASDVETAGGAAADHDAAGQAGGTPERARGSVAASDAFFPFADGFQVLADAGVRAVVQPGGSIRDDEVIEAAKAAGVTMYFTGARHFAH
ncbi:phosphoribosylaminoimidazolecarboxamide formyltransferase/IMP cyclohydrolase [Arcanobacterium pluranimalium]|uniref:bifunctional phosphoribosylaminoimidazolecarboxamide formyltransferase/IMP cyclohydrolase n=1 Tax=Arcanobacterium pluranimalium TaxID=108028 RepID=UPI00195A54A9|nr:bifunctional phosphoribosylaminoimidazolecarboxamide formyltransferase/IMP cyclohydrolase [Arcanobacterium pluranimalium]MBM7825049.1 phosphoribosylaminoimidazolecarboxamide formyltransferase/IMP cyclohydrolase [Arcanobacterium pluranimalium]